MIKISATGIESNSLRLSLMNRSLRANLRKEIVALSIEAVAGVKKKMSGEVLHVQSGLLRNSVNFSINVEDNAIAGVIGSPVKYAKVHEYGFKGMVNIPSHIRRTKAQMKKARYSYKNNDGGVTTKVRMTGKFGKSVGQTVVRAHSRNMNMPERSTFRAVLREMSGDIKSRIRGAVTRSIK